MDEHEWLAERFEEHRAHLRSVAYRMLGSVTEADDAVQDTWLRFSRAGVDDVENLRGWMTTIVARVCMNMLRSRKARPEDPMGVHLPDPVVSPDGDIGPEQAALLADSVSLALIVVLDTLTPAERLAFVLHDMFDLPFDEIAPMVSRSSAATRQLASRARRRVKDVGAPAPDPDLRAQRGVVDAFFAAARGGDFDALIELLDPEIVMRTSAGAARPDDSVVVHGAAAVARRAMMFAQPAAVLRPALVNGAAGVVVVVGGRPVSVMGFTVANGSIAAIDSYSDPERLSRLDPAFLDA